MSALLLANLAASVALLALAVATMPWVGGRQSAGRQSEPDLPTAGARLPTGEA